MSQVSPILANHPSLFCLIFGLLFQTNVKPTNRISCFIFVVIGAIKYLQSWMIWKRTQEKK